ncbi:hypothetical protein [Tenacibaculum aiptasiae]|uniref:hypothetical protein n=1 Tax=Tenacibaculum aiptasiae TaxID=426481 RepID=UPI00232D5F81|nr:hypothetical protein [Tenacibaculum aiptasiae]
MKQLKAKVVNIRIPAGDNNDTQPLHIELGKVVKCALFKEEAPDQPVNVKIEDIQGHELHPSVTYKEYEPTNGNHYDSRKDIHFDGNREIRVIAQAKSALRKDFVFQMMFYFEH